MAEYQLAHSAREIDEKLTKVDVLARDKLDVSELASAINTALANAKASGEFNGAEGPQGLRGIQGEPGIDGTDGKDGNDGIGITAATINDAGELVLAFSDDTTSNLGVIIGVDGKDGAQGPKGDTGEQGPKGDKGDKGDTGATGSTGADGKTPIKGTDYWTAVDQESIIQRVLNAINQNIIGEVTTDNIILVSAQLPNGSYTMRYENLDGSTTEISSFTVENSSIVEGSVSGGSGSSGNEPGGDSGDSGGSESGDTTLVGVNGELPGPEYGSDGRRNEIRYAISDDDEEAIYNTVGYKRGAYLSNDGSYGTSNKPSIAVTGLIPVQLDDVVRLANVGLISGNTNYRIVTYDADRNFCGYYGCQSQYPFFASDGNSQGVCKGVRNENNELIEFTVATDSNLFVGNFAFMRICSDAIGPESIITIERTTAANE